MTMTNPYAPPRAAVADVVVDASAEPADPGTRLAAAILDGIIMAAMVYLPLIVATSFAEQDEGGAQAAVIVGGIATAVGLIAWCWLTIKYVRRNGQSIAKKMLHIKVVRSDGSPASLGRIFWLRNVVNGVISIIPLYGLIDVLFIFGDARQCLHDKIADTIVVKE